jgi:hypothetical protein
MRFLVAEITLKHVFLFEFPPISHSYHHCSVLICDSLLMCDIREEATHLWPLLWLLNRVTKLLSFHFDITEGRPFYRILHKKDWHDALNLYSRDVLFESQPGHRLIWLTFVVFLSPINQMPGWYPQLGHCCLLPNPSQVISRLTKRHSAIVVQILASL